MFQIKHWGLGGEFLSWCFSTCYKWLFFYYYLSANSVLYAVQAKKPRQSFQNEYAF